MLAHSAPSIHRCGLTRGAAGARAGGSAEVPEGELVVRLYEGAVGPTRLAQAQARAALDARQRLTFSADLVPAEAGRHAGHVHVAGGLPLHPAPPGAHTSSSRSASCRLR